MFDVGAILLAVLTDAGLFLLAFRALTARQVPTRDLRVGAVAAAVGWQVVQLLGTYFVTHALRGTREATASPASCSASSPGFTWRSGAMRMRYALLRKRQN